jgi:hypothetical protein
MHWVNRSSATLERREIMKRKTNPLINAINNATEQSRKEGHNLISRAKILEEARMKIRVNYSGVFKDLDLNVHNLFVRTSYHKPTIAVNMNSLESFKDTQLIGLLEFFSSKTEKATTRDWPQYLNRDYTFELDDVLVSISAFVRTDSPTCRKVQTGVKVEEVPQFELVCD